MGPTDVRCYLGWAPEKYPTHPRHTWPPSVKSSNPPPLSQDFTGIKVGGGECRRARFNPGGGRGCPLPPSSAFSQNNFHKIRGPGQCRGVGCWSDPAWVGGGGWLLVPTSFCCSNPVPEPPPTGHLEGSAVDRSPALSYRLSGRSCLGPSGSGCTTRRQA